MAAPEGQRSAGFPFTFGLGKPEAAKMGFLSVLPGIQVLIE